MEVVTVTRRARNQIEMLDDRLVKLDRMVQRLRTLIGVLHRDGLDGIPEQGLLRSFEMKQQAALAEREKLLQEQMQGNLFSEAEERKQVKELRKVPFDFYYRYVCDTPDGERECKHKIVDWEAGALFWKCRQSYGPDWEKPFRAKLEEDLGGKDLMFLMGNQHRFQDQWLIISLVYPPKRKPVDDRQASLF